MDYKRMYLTLFDTQTQAVELLVKGHQKAEEIAMEDEPGVTLLRPDQDNGEDGE